MKFVLVVFYIKILVTQYERQKVHAHTVSAVFLNLVKFIHIRESRETECKKIFPYNLDTALVHLLWKEISFNN